MMTPTMAGIAAGILTLFAGLCSVPGTSFNILYSNNKALIVPTSRGWLRIHCFFVFVACVALLVVGLKIWTLTLYEKSNIFGAYSQTTETSPNMIEALQEQVYFLHQCHCSYL
jgi:hypothetical protein